MMPVTFLHFLVSTAYLILQMAALKLLATTFPDSAIGRGLSFLVF